MMEADQDQAFSAVTFRFAIMLHSLRRWYVSWERISLKMSSFKISHRSSSFIRIYTVPNPSQASFHITLDQRQRIVYVAHAKIHSKSITSPYCKSKQLHQLEIRVKLGVINF